MAHSTEETSKASDTPDQLLESLGRLSQKSGVLATIILDRVSGAIIKTTGTLARVRSTSTAADGAPETQGMEDLATRVWKYMAANDDLVHGLDAEDDLKLLRIRTKKYELVIVPNPKYLLVVVHETPAA